MGILTYRLEVAYFRMAQNLRGRMGLREDSNLVNARDWLIETLTRKGIWLRSLMMVELPINIDPLTGENFRAERLPEIIEKAKEVFGENINFVEAMMIRFKNDKRIMGPAMRDLENVLSRAEANGFSARKLVAAIYFWLIDSTFSSIPGNPFRLLWLLERADEIMSKGADPARRLWIEALTAKNQGHVV